MRRNLYLVDGSAVLYRSHFAFSRNPLVTSTGLPTSAVFGLAGFLARLFRERKPDHLLLALDTPTPTFRHRLYPAYKANRQKMPEDLVQQLPLIDELLEALSVTVLRMPGFEADDLIASATRRFRKEGLEVFIVSGDKDLCQLVGEEVTVLAPGKDQFAQVLDAAAVEQKFGVPPDRLLDWLALVGDASDNVPGVPGMFLPIGSSTGWPWLEMPRTMSPGCRGSGPRKLPPCCRGSLRSRNSTPTSRS